MGMVNELMKRINSESLDSKLYESFGLSKIMESDVSKMNEDEILAAMKDLSKYMGSSYSKTATQKLSERYKVLEAKLNGVNLNEGKVPKIGDSEEKVIKALTEGEDRNKVVYIDGYYVDAKGNKEDEFSEYKCMIGEYDENLDGEDDDDVFYWFENEDEIRKYVNSPDEFVITGARYEDGTEIDLTKPPAAGTVKEAKDLTVGQEVDISMGNAQLVYNIEGKPGEKFEVKKDGTMLPKGKYEVVMAGTAHTNGPWGSFSDLTVKVISLDGAVKEAKDKKWMQKAFSKRKGGLHKALGLKPDEKISVTQMKKALADPKTKKMAQAAVNANPDVYKSLKESVEDVNEGEKRSYAEYLERKKKEFGDKFDPSDLAKKFVEYFENGKCIEVKFKTGDVARGRVGVTTGHVPAFMLLRTTRSTGSSDVLYADDEIVREVSESVDEAKGDEVIVVKLESYEGEDTDLSISGGSTFAIIGIKDKSIDYGYKNKYEATEAVMKAGERIYAGKDLIVAGLKSVDGEDFNVSLSPDPMYIIINPSYEDGNVDYGYESYESATKAAGSADMKNESIVNEYRIVRFFRDNKPKEVIKTGLSIEDAMDHCKDPDSKGDGWFDGFEEERSDEVEESKEPVHIKDVVPTVMKRAKKKMDEVERRKKGKSGKEKNESIVNEGQFSWHLGDKSTDPIYSTSGHEEIVYMFDDKGNKWKEEHYEGYGVFGGKDFYELLAEMNPQFKNEEGKELRDHGIHIAFGTLQGQKESPSGDNTPGVKYPRFSRDENAKYEDLVNPAHHANQGWYEDDDSSDDVDGEDVDEKVKTVYDSWFKEGLKEFGITEEEYSHMSSKQKEEVKKSLRELGHMTEGVKTVKEMIGDGEKYNLIARGISDKDVAARIATDKKGVVVVDDKDTKKFMVIMKESVIKVPEKKACAHTPGNECKCSDNKKVVEGIVNSFKDEFSATLKEISETIKTSKSDSAALNERLSNFIKLKELDILEKKDKILSKLNGG